MFFVKQLPNFAELGFKDIPDGDLASQPTVSGFGNGTEKQTVFALCYACIDRYVSALSGRIEVITDIDSTGDPTRGAQ